MSRPATPADWAARLAEQGVSEETIATARRTAEGFARATAALPAEPGEGPAPLDLVPLLLARREGGA